MKPYEPPANRVERPLESWKEIAAHLQRDTTTVQRWEKTEGLPVHRHTHQSRRSVYAYRSEIDAWKNGRKPAPDALVARPSWRPLGFGVTTLLCLVMVGNGIRPVSAQQTDGERMRQVPFESGTETPSPDGRYLSYTDWSTGDLAVRDLATGAKRRLTDDGGIRKASGHVAESLIAPNGRQVAYVFLDTKRNLADLRLVAWGGADARKPRILYRTDDTRYLTLSGWTPDSGSILVKQDLADGTSQIAIISVEDGSARVLKSFGWRTLAEAALSPDGRYVAYSGAESATDWDIFLLASDGSREARLTEGPAVDSLPFWTPDSSHVLFFSDRTGASQSLWTVAVKDGKANGPARLVRPDFGSGAFFPTGMTRTGALYFFTGFDATNLYTAEFDAAMKIAKPPAAITERFVNSTAGGSWSPDGESLAYYAFRGRSQIIPGGTDLIIRTLKTGAERIIRMPELIVPPYLYTPPPRWFPDGRSVMVVSYGRRHAGFELYRVDLGSGSAELLQSTQGSGPSANSDLSPDGKAIFYSVGDTATGMRLMRFDLDGRRETELKRIPSNKSFTPMAVSPDGKQLAYGVLDSPISTVAAEAALEIMPASGGQERQVFHGRMLPNPVAWSPDQRYLFIRTPGANFPLWRVPIVGGKLETIGSLRGRVVFFQVHPDGRRIVFGSNGENRQQLWVWENFLPGAPEHGAVN